MIIIRTQEDNGFAPVCDPGMAHSFCRRGDKVTAQNRTESALCGCKATLCERHERALSKKLFRVALLARDRARGSTKTKNAKHTMHFFWLVRHLQYAP
jgi:hypothetical protein